ncbi:MAG TPA: alpha/beta fold hydrolase [Gemmatimonadales bacterium]|nr:alpha/beta fold hydrolase [Gemmatimonadales bacterium]
MNLAPLEMSVPAGDGLVLKGTLTYPDEYAGAAFPLAVLAHQYPATRDSYAPLVVDLLDSGVATLAFDLRGHGASIISPRGPMVIDTPEGLTIEAFGQAFMSSAGKVGFSRLDNDILRVVSWGANQNFIDARRLGLVGASIGGSAVLLALSTIPGLCALVTVGAAGAPAISDDAADRIRANLEKIRVPCFLASSREDPFDGGGNVTRWSEGLSHVSERLIPGSAHAMAIYFDVREELLRFLLPRLGVQ